MHDIDLILTITGGLAAALVLGYITFKLHLSPIVGYLLAGIVVGPTTPGYIADQGLADQLAEVGVILLMFGVGLQSHLKELLAVRRVVIPGAICQTTVATILGAVVGHFHGWGWAAGTVFGMSIAVASTVVLVRVLEDNDDLHTQPGHIAIGWLVMEDLFTVLALVMLPAVFGAGASSAGGIAGAVGIAMLKMTAMVVLTLIVGDRVIPWLLDKVAATRSRELFTLTVLVSALGVAVAATKLFDVSMALGAFLAGIVIGRSRFSLRAATEALPMRDAFAVLFFVSVGMLFDVRALFESPGLIAATLAIILLGKPLAALTIVLLLGYPARAAATAALVLAQIGEFSFILVTGGKALGLLDNEASNVIIAAAIISITLNPIIYRFLDPLEKLLKRFERSSAPVEANLQRSIDELEASDRHRAVMVGHGPVGNILSRLLRENQIDPVVIEMNAETVRRLGDQGIRAIHGDALHRDVLEHAGLDKAIGFILSSSTTRGAKEAIRLAREINPDLFILARATYLSQAAELRAAGADCVYSGEGEVALAMIEFLLEHLGATAEQVDRERDRVRAELLFKTQNGNDGQPGGDSNSSPTTASSNGSPASSAAHGNAPVDGS